jgi:hypothetical protein
MKEFLSVIAGFLVVFFIIFYVFVESGNIVVGFLAMCWALLLTVFVVFFMRNI